MDQNTRQIHKSGPLWMWLTPPGTYNPNARGSDACRGSNFFMDQTTKQIHKGWPPRMWFTPPGLTTQMSVGQIPVGEQLSMDQNTRQIHKGGPPWMCGQHNVRASAGDSTGQNTTDTHPIPGYELKFLTPLGIEPWPAGWMAGTLMTTPRRRMVRFIHLF